MGDWPYLLGSERYKALEACCTGLQPGHGGVPAAVLLHEHNAEVATAILRSVALLEVPLRNVLAAGLQELADTSSGTGQPWYLEPLPSGLAQDEFALKSVSKAIRTGAAVARRQRRTMVPGDVVAAFSLGFWTKLLSRGCDDLWPQSLYRQFPGLGRSIHVDQASKPSSWRYRKWLHERLNVINDERNRSAHHERVFDTDLKRLGRYLVGTAGAISPSLAGRVKRSWTAETVALCSPLLAEAG